VSLWEQARAYRALARQGRGGDLRLLLPSSSPGAAAGNADAPRSLAATASFVVADILADRVARARAFGLDNALATPYWTAVKTGTSKDMRDNWCVGFSRRHTVAVWVGNFEGDPMHDVSGVSGAAPAWRQVMDHLAAAAGGTASGPPPPAGLVRSVLSYAQDREPARREWFLAGTVPTAPVEAAQDAARAPRILSPANGMVMALDPDIPVERQRLPWRATGDLQGLSWRLGDESLGAAADAVMWQPRRGSFRLQLVDAGGSVRDSAFFTVR
jgi:penicillin-binding protein 1C